MEVIVGPGQVVASGDTYSIVTGLRKSRAAALIECLFMRPQIPAMA
jgi:hypothetical protein